jgi:excisionase family DNA binding protein
VTEIANIVGLHPATIRQWIRQGRLESARRSGGRWLVRGDEIARLLESTQSLGNAHRSKNRPGTEPRGPVDPDANRRRGPRSGPRAIAMSIQQGLRP